MRAYLFSMELIILSLVFPVSGATQQGQLPPGYVCTSLDLDSGQCLAWQPIDVPQRRQNSGQHSYDNDYRIPPSNHRRELFKGLPTGNAFMPSTEYAPGFGSASQPVYKQK